MGYKIHFNFARKFGQDGLKVKHDEILLWSQIYKNYSLVPKLGKNYNLNPKYIMGFWEVML